MADFLHLRGWRVSEVEERAHEYIVHARYDAIPDSCPHCGVIGQLWRHQPVQSEFRDIPSHGKLVTIIATRHRLRCKDCLKTSVAPLPDMTRKRRMTVRCRDWIAEACLQRPFTQIASEVGVDEKTVRQIAQEHIREADAAFRPYAPIILGLDELKLDGRLRVMCTDVQQGQPIDILERFSRPAIVRWLSFLRERQRIRAIALDMSETFRSSVRAALPTVPIVADKFHVVRAATGALNMVRIAKGRAAKTKTARRHAFRGRYLLLKNPGKLTAEQAFKLDGMLLNDAELRGAYEAKERFLAIWDEPTREAAEVAMEAWLASVPAEHATAFQRAARALTEWREEILNYWNPDLFGPGITNAYTEAVNGIAKVANRAGRGYGFSVIRARVLHGRPRIDPDEMVECEWCETRFARGMLVSQEPVYEGRGRRRRLMTICPNCYRTHADGSAEINHDSTLQSE